jgi:hypothetical protein
VKRRKGWLKAKRQQTVTDDQMLRLVNGILANSNSKPISGEYVWSDLLSELLKASSQLLSQFSNDRISVGVVSEATAATSERVVCDRILDRKGFLRWLEDMTRPSPTRKQPSRTDAEKNLLRWQAVFEAHRDGVSWKDTYEAASKRLKGTPDAGTPRSMRRSYTAVQRMRRDARYEW